MMETFWNCQCSSDVVTGPAGTATSSVTTSIHNTELSLNCFHRELKTFYLYRAYLYVIRRSRKGLWLQERENVTFPT